MIISNMKNTKGENRKVNRITAYILAAALTLGFTINPLSAIAVETSSSASVDIMSSYIWRGFELHEDVAVQPSVGITYGGFGANLWSDYNTDTEEAVETDLTLNYAFPIDKFSIEAGYIYFALDGANDTQELYLTVGYDVILSPSITVYYDIEEGDGAFLTASIGHSFTLPKDMSLDLGVSVSYNAESKYSIGDYNEFHNADLSASLGIPVTENTSITPMIAGTFALSDEAEAAIEALSADGDESSFIYGGVNLTLSF